MKKNIWNIQKSHSGQRLLSFLKEKEASLSLKDLRWAIEHNFCLVNGLPERFASARLNEGDQVYLFEFIDYKKEISHVDTSKILYEDNHLLAYNKPAFIPSVGSYSLETLLKRNYTLYPVHRLDRDTTGIILFAKTAFAKEKLEEGFKLRTIAKNYLCVVSAKPKFSSGHIKNYLGEVKREPGKVTYGVVNKERGLLSETEWFFEKEMNFQHLPLYLIRCQPLTGRTHQIRVHLKSIGSPLLGDIQYGGCLKPYFPHYFLHAESMTLPLPFYSTPLFLKAPLPSYFNL